MAEAAENLTFMAEALNWFVAETFILLAETLIFMTETLNLTAGLNAQFYYWNVSQLCGWSSQRFTAETNRVLLAAVDTKMRQALRTQAFIDPEKLTMKSLALPRPGIEPKQNSKICHRRSLISTGYRLAAGFSTKLLSSASTLSVVQLLHTTLRCFISTLLLALCWHHRYYIIVSVLSAGAERSRGW